MVKKWQLMPQKSSDLIEQILINRQIKKEDWSSFLNPQYSDLFDPFLMKNMKEAVARLRLAIKRHEKIGLFGDYDADGIPGTALLYEYLKNIGLEVCVYIPTRDEGYGLSKRGIEILKKEGATLILTIDLGVRNPQEISYAQKLKLAVIVLDHHEIIGQKPKCLILNPKQKEDKYPFRELSATGIVFKFVQALNKECKIISDNTLKWALDLVAISTICDMVPLVSENRIFAKYGLIVLRKTKNIGLAKLYQKAAILPETIDTYSVGFQIGPRLNAPGRMAEANESFFLLISQDRQEADKLAEKLDSVNRDRQNELARVLKEAEVKVIKDNLDKNKVIIVCGQNWPSGIVGLVAGKLMEEYTRPVIVCEEKDGQLRGSARSIEAYNMIEALDKAKLYLTRYGGHKRAAGLSLELNHLSNLYDKLLEIAESKLKEGDLIPKIIIDAKVTAVDLDLQLFKRIENLAPFGLGNPRPVFQLLGANITEIKTVGKNNNHLKFKAQGIKAIGFDLAMQNNNLKENTKADLVFTLDEDSWDGIPKIQLKVLDIKII